MAIAKQIQRAQNDQLSKVIVQCPACSTKFAVEGAMLQALETPRFHCSRCDNVFALEAAKTTPMTLVPTLSSSEQVKQPIAQPSTPTVSIEIPRYESSIPAVQAPHEGSNLGFDAQQMTFDFGVNEARGSRSVSWDFPPDGSVVAGEVQERRPSPASVEAAPAPRPQRASWRNVAWLMAPILMCLAAIAWVSFSLAKNPDDGRLFTSFVTPENLLAPPAGLSLSDLRFEPITLDDGEIVYVISGILTNNTTTSLKEIIVEGLTFDRAGALHHRIAMNVSASLAKTRIQSLNTEMLANLQAGRVAKRFELNPGESYPFTFAMLGAPSTPPPGFFSARVYTAR